MANERDAFMREIDEEVRRERYLRIWNAYGVYILGAAAAVVLIFGGWRFYVAQQQAAAARAGAQFVEVTQLLAEGKNEDGLRGFEQIAKEGPEGYAQLAKLRLAADARKQSKTAEAIAHYEALAKDQSADKLLRGFADLQIAALKVDTASWTEIKNHLTDLVKDDSAWKFAARELVGLAAFKAGEFSEARKAFTELLASGDTPATLRQRAQLALALVAQAEAPAESAASNGTQPETKDEATGSGKEQKQQ